MFPETRLLPAFLSFSSSDRIKKRNEQLLQMLPKYHPWHLFSSMWRGRHRKGWGEWVLAAPRSQEHSQGPVTEPLPLEMKLAAHRHVPKMEEAINMAQTAPHGERIESYY